MRFCLDALTKLADLYCRKKMYKEMEPLLIEALQIREDTFGDEHHTVSTELKNLARVYMAQERYSVAEPLLKRAINIRTKAYGRNHRRTIDALQLYVSLLKKTNRFEKADEIWPGLNNRASSLLGCKKLKSKTGGTLPFSPNTSNLIHTIQESAVKFLNGVRTMNDALDFQASAYYFTYFQSRSLASLQPRTIKPVVTEDGSKFYYDCDGEIVYALYSTGAVVSIHPNNVAARTASGDYWMVGPNGNSFRVD